MWNMEFFLKKKKGDVADHYPDDSLDVFWQHRPVQLVGANGASDEESSGATQYLSDQLHPCESFMEERRGEETEGERSELRGVVILLVFYP